MMDAQRVRGLIVAFAVATWPHVAGADAAVSEQDALRTINAVLSAKPLPRLGLYSAVSLQDGLTGLRIELPFDDLQADTRRRARAAGWQSNDLVSIILTVDHLSVCAADGSDGC